MLIPVNTVDICTAMRGHLHVSRHVTGESVAGCSAVCNVANGVRINGEKANGPCAIYEVERFLLLGVAISGPHCSTR
jgi:hypothetical protein